MGVFQQFYRIGHKNGGSPFQYDFAREGAVVEKIEAWAGGSQLRGVRLHFSNGQTKLIGAVGGRYQGSFSLDYNAGEYVTSLSIWGNGAGTRCGAFRIKTNTNRLYFPQMTSWGLKTEYKMEVGSGIILGAWGRHGIDVDSLGILCLRKIIGTDMVSVNYDMRGDNLRPPEKRNAVDVTQDNPSPSVSDKGYQKVTKASRTGGSWSVTAGLTFGQEYKVKGGVPLVGEGESTTKWHVTVSGTYGKEWSITDGFELSIALIIPAYSKVRFIVDYYEGQLDKLAYTAKMKYFLDNNDAFYTNVRGMYKGVSTSRFIQQTQVLATWNKSKYIWDPVGVQDRSLNVSLNASTDMGIEVLESTHSEETALNGKGNEVVEEDFGPHAGMFNEHIVVVE